MAEIRTSTRGIFGRDGKLLVIRHRDKHGDFYALPGGAPDFHGVGFFFECELLSVE